MPYEKILFMVLTTVIFISFVHPDQPQRKKNTLGEGFWDCTVPESAREAWQSTVQVRLIRICEPGETQRKVKIGAGIILEIDSERQAAIIVTSKHCIDGLTNRQYLYDIKFPGKPEKESEKEKYYTARNVSIIETQPFRDLVYLEVKYPDKAQFLAANLQPIDNDHKPYDNLIAIGFPNLQMRSRKSWNVSRPKNFKKIIKRFSRGKLLAKGQSADNVYILAHNADILPGNCGGPLVDHNGNVIGINAGLFYPDVAKNSESSKYDYCPGNPNMFYYAVSSSEILKGFESIKKNK